MVFHFVIGAIKHRGKLKYFTFAIHAVAYIALLLTTTTRGSKTMCYAYHVTKQMLWLSTA